MDKKIIFLDVDGTLVDFHGHMPESAKETLKKARENGHQLVLCTGRLKSQIYPEVLDMNFDGIISSAGAYVEHEGKTVYHYRMDKQHLQRLIDYFEDKNTAYCLQTEEGVLVTERSKEQILRHFRESGMDEEKMNKIMVTGIKVDMKLRERTDVEKGAYYDCPEGIGDIQKALGGYFKVEGSSYEKSDGDSGEITCADVNKATGIEHYIQHIGGRLEDTVAVGDGPNDVEMLGFAAVSVAMGNASEDLKAIADFVTADVQQDGIKKAFEALKLI